MSADSLIVENVKDDDYVREWVKGVGIAEWPVWPASKRREAWTAAHWSAVALAEFELCCERCYRRGVAWLAMGALALAVADCHGDAGRISAVLEDAGLEPWPRGASAVERADWRRRHWHWCEADYYEHAAQATPGRSERKRRAVLRSGWLALLDAEQRRFELEGPWWRTAPEPGIVDVDVERVLAVPALARLLNWQLADCVSRPLERGTLHRTTETRTS
jgi:hypothetical protein